ncbi:MAG TPA: SPOR domain-containing protein [Sphingobium sp.]
MPSPINRLARVLPWAVVACIGAALHAQPSRIDQPSRIESADMDAPRGAILPDRNLAAPMLDDVGYAGIIADSGPSMDGVIVAAHRTLPVSAYAEVTSLATGRTIVVRIATHGLPGKDRVIDLSCGAIRQLGLSALPAPIRVRRVNPPEQEQAALNAGKPVAERIPSPPGLLSALRKKLPPAVHANSRPESDECPRTADETTNRPDTPLPVTPKTPKAPPPARQVAQEKPKPKPALPDRVAPRPMVVPKSAVEPAKGSGFAIQVAAFSNRAKADALARTLGGHVETAGGIARVRKGPYATEAAARAALPQIRAKGFADARVVTNEGR